MNRISVEATKTNNSDVITTSSACTGKYHFLVTNSNKEGLESGYLCLITDEKTLNTTLIRDGRPNDLPAKAGEYTEFGDLHVDIGDVSSLGTLKLFHWNGKKWVECGTRHMEEYLKNQE